MQFRFFVALKEKYRNKRKVKSEMCALRCILAQAGSFKSFCITNDVFDAASHKAIKNRNRLLEMYRQGFDNLPVYVINKN